MSLTRHRALVAHLRRAVTSLRTPHRGAWSGYTTRTSYSEEAARSKTEIVRTFLAEAGGRTVLDIGANEGTFSLVAADGGRDVVAMDSDWSAMDALYRRVRGERLAGLLPLVADIANPSPAVGWGGEERQPLLDRVRADTVMALALVHHLAIGRNVPLPMLLAVLARLGRKIILEWVPKEDPMVRRLLASRDDVFPDYTIERLREAAAAIFRIVREAQVADSARVLLLLERKS